MTDLAYTPFKAKLLQGSIDLDSGGDDVRVVLCMSNTTADTDEDAAHLGTAEITTLDEYDGGGYARVALASETVSTDLANDRGEFDAGDFTWTALTAGSRNAVGMVVYQHNDATDDTLNIPLVWIDSGGFPFAGNGGDVTVTWNAEGIIQAT